MPFGEEVARASYGTDSVRQKFTSYERDGESEEDFAQARYYNYKLGRFNSVDPLMASADIINPQTFNRYAYVGNNPVNITDPTGKQYGINSAGTVQWFAGDLGTGFTPYNLLYGYIAGTTQMVALSPTGGAPVNVASAAEWLSQEIAWGGTAVTLAEGASALAGGIGTVAAMVALKAAIDPTGRYDDSAYYPEPVREAKGMQQSYWNAFLKKADENHLMMSNGQSDSSSSSANMQGQTTPANPDPNDNKPFGSKGTQTTSTTVWQRGQHRIDVENPNPGQRAGQIHFQDQATRAKYLYDPKTNTFINAPRNINRMLEDKRVQRAIDKAFKVLGEER